MILKTNLKNNLKNKRIVLSKTNQIGDVIFALPLAYLLKQAEPSCTIIFLGRAYTQGLINSCLDIDEFADWESTQKLSDQDQIQAFKNLKADIFINIHPKKAIAKLAKQAKIPMRIGTSHRIYHWLTCNKLVSVSRKKSNLHETQLDLFLLKPLGLKTFYSLEEIIPMRRFKQGVVNQGALNLDAMNCAPTQKFNLVIHPLTRGRHIEWPLENYAELLKYLDPEKFNIFITGSELEGVEIRPYLIQPFSTKSHIHDLTGQLSLEELLNFLSCQTDGLICSSTGPIHLAAAFGKHVLGLYAPIKPFDAGRWGPVGSKAEVLSLNKDCSDCRDGSRCRCVGLIQVSQVIKIIRRWEAK